MDLLPAPKSTPTISVVQGGRTIVRFNLRNDDGATIDLNSCRVTGAPDDRNAPKFTDGITNIGAAEVKLVFRDSGGAPAPALLVDGKVLDHKTGQVEFVVEPALTVGVGTYDAQVGVFFQGKLFKTWPVLAEVTPNLFAGNPGSSASWVRIALRDQHVYDDSLLADREFTDAEVMHAARRAIDRFNDTPPLVATYDLANFPYRDKLVTGIAGYLYQLAAAKYRRDHLPYAGAGLQVDDKNKAQEYEAISQQRLAEFDAWVITLKHAINAENFWGVA